MTRTRLDFEGRRKAIVGAAMPLFARHGFAGTTTKEIAKAAAVSEALVFQHFPSKAALYQEILQQGCQGDPGLEALAALPPSTATVVRMTELLLDCFVRGGSSEAKERDCRHRLALNSFLDDGEYLLLLHGWVMERIYPLFRSAMEAADSIAVPTGTTVFAAGSGHIMVELDEPHAAGETFPLELELAEAGTVTVDVEVLSWDQMVDRIESAEGSSS